MSYLKLWLDDIRPAPDGYIWCKSVEEAKTINEALFTIHAKINNNIGLYNSIPIIETKENYQIDNNSIEKIFMGNLFNKIVF